MIQKGFLKKLETCQKKLKVFTHLHMMHNQTFDYI
jgi:hypothetical protein